MSRAFVNEDQAAAQAATVVERRVSDQPNYVTESGLSQLRQRLSDTQKALTQEQARGDASDKQRVAECEAALRYLHQRLQSAQLVPVQPDATQVRIGSWVTFADEDGHERTIRLVGEDEADVVEGLVNWGSPLGRALLGASEGDEVSWSRPSGEVLIEVVKIVQG